MPSSHIRWIALSALIGALGVALGALGAHGLADALEKLGYVGDDLAHRLDIFDTAVQYQMIHALALGLTGLLLQQRPSRAQQAAAWFFLAGIVLFSGLLYVLTFAGPNWSRLGAIVPIGGVAFIVGWLALAIGAWRA